MKDWVGKIRKKKKEKRKKRTYAGFFLIIYFAIFCHNSDSFLSITGDTFFFFQYIVLPRRNSPNLTAGS